MLVHQVLEKYLVFVAKTGNTVGYKLRLESLPGNMIDVLQVFAWPKIKPAVRVKLESIIEDFNLAMPEDQVGLLQ